MVDGVVRALHRKAKSGREHGIPKLGVDAIEVVESGAVGDFNRYRTEKLGGTNDHALLLLAAETLEELRREWPIARGDLGENVLVEGLPPLAPGQRVGLGESLVELTEPCVPCSTLRVLPYVGRERLKAFLRSLRGRRGVYARVLRGGVVRVGDRAALL